MSKTGYRLQTCGIDGCEWETVDSEVNGFEHLLTAHSDLLRRMSYDAACGVYDE